ncbi:MAG: hypothetical protein CMH30_04740 [Micavibrio sp.]|nr:hypothetical protein [Micavibrio sp.]
MAIKIAFLAFSFVALMLTAGCGDTQGERTLSGAGIGAGVGAVGGALVGGSATTGAAVGAAVGGATGAMTDKEDINFDDD